MTRNTPRRARLRTASPRTATPHVRSGEALRDRLRSIASQAMQAQRMSVNSDNLLDAIDDLDNDLQAVIEMVNRARREAQ
jgi:hypothetical protein